MAQLTRKAGATISLPCLYKDGAGAAVDLTGYTVTSQVRRVNRVKLATFTYTMDPDQVTNRGRFVLSITSASSASWPAATYRCDVRITSAGGIVEFSDTFDFKVLLAETL